MSTTQGPGTTRGTTIQKNEELEEPDPLDIPDPAKIIRCETFADEPNKPRAYFENTSKEELVNEHVLEY